MKVSNIVKKEFSSKLVHKKNLKINIEGSRYICTPLALIDSIYIKYKNYYPQVFLMEGHYNNIDHSDGEYFDEIYSDEGYFEE